MNLSESEQKNTEIFRNYILNNFGDKYNCKACNGTGLANFSKLSFGGCYWDGVSYCDICKGSGISREMIEFEKDGSSLMKCSCNGSSTCKICKGIGFLDWISSILGRYR